MVNIEQYKERLSVRDTYTQGKKSPERERGGKKGKDEAKKKNRDEADKWGKEAMKWIKTGKKGEQ